MCVFVIEVNWQISAAVRKTSPSAISLKRRSSRPLAANSEHDHGRDGQDEGEDVHAGSRGSAPEVWAVASGRLQFVACRPRRARAAAPMFGDDVDEGGADGVAHRLRAADVDVAASGEQAPDERALLPDPVLDVIAAAGPLARRRDVNVIEHSLGGELPDLVAVDVVQAARPDAVEQRRFRRAGRRPASSPAVPRGTPASGRSRCRPRRRSSASSRPPAGGTRRRCPGRRSGGRPRGACARSASSSRGSHGRAGPARAWPRGRRSGGRRRRRGSAGSSSSSSSAAGAAAPPAGTRRCSASRTGTRRAAGARRSRPRRSPRAAVSRDRPAPAGRP